MNHCALVPVADLIAVKGDSPANVTVLEQVDFVMKGGNLAKKNLPSHPVEIFD